MMGYQVFLKVNRRQFKCESCEKVFSEELGFVKKRRTYTKRLGEKVIKEVLETNVDCAGRKKLINIFPKVVRLLEDGLTKLSLILITGQLRE
jgi:transposase-like protein